MKTQNNTLKFNKNTMVELNNDDLLDVNGGSTPAVAAASSGGCLMAAGAALAWVLR